MQSYKCYVQVCYIHICICYIQNHLALYIFNSDFANYCSKMKVLSEKMPLTQTEGFLMSHVNIWPKLKQCLQKTVKFGTFCKTHLLYTCIRSLRKSLTLWRGSKYWCLKETVISSKKTFVHADNLGQNIYISKNCKYV